MSSCRAKSCFGGHASETAVVALRLAAPLERTAAHVDYTPMQGPPLARMDALEDCTPPTEPPLARTLVDCTPATELPHASGGQRS